MSGLSVLGSLTVTKSGVADVSANAIVDSVHATEYSADRSKATDSLAYSYYIMADYDINGQITHEASANDGTDDSWGLNGFIVNNTNAVNASLSLPTASSKSIPAGLIDAIDTDDNTATPAGVFPVTLTLNLDNQGVLTASATISGNDVLSDATGENVLKAQVVAWEVNGETSAFVEPTVEEDTQDVLTATLTADMLKAHYSAQLDALVAAYDNKNVVSSWEINIQSILLATNNSLSQHARNLSRASNKVFARDAKIVAASHAVYCVDITDYQGTSIELASGNVYGVIKQTNAGASDEQA